MSNDNTPTTSTGIGFTGLLTIVFIVLKLTKVIAWSWFWVLSPTIFGIIILLIIIGLFVWVITS